VDKDNQFNTFCGHFPDSDFLKMKKVTFEVLTNTLNIAM